jgi:hypothetical protein
MRDQFELATTVPHDEHPWQKLDCPTNIYSRMEARALINQLHRVVGEGPEGTRLTIISCPHDFGTYLDVAVVFDDEREDHVEWMLKVESRIPSRWDKEAREELGSQGYPLTNSFDQ